MSVTALEILRAAREYAADADHISLSPYGVYETSEGAATTQESAVRGCLLGIEGIVCHRLGVEDATPAEHRAFRLLDAAAAALYDGPDDHFTGTMKSGHVAVLAAYDEAIRRAEA